MEFSNLVRTEARTPRERSPSPVSPAIDDEGSNVLEFAKDLAVRLAVGSACFPLAHIKTLMQLGYEPFPLTKGKTFFCRRETYFYPNVIAYGKRFVEEKGLMALYRGVDAAIIANFVSGSVMYAARMCLDRFFPHFGGKPAHIQKNENDLSHTESASLAVREALREAASRTIATIVSRPFVVVVTRKVAQVIGGEMKYNSVMSSLLVIGNEEGIKGYFAGLVPQIIAELITVFGVHCFVYFVQRTPYCMQTQVKGGAQNVELAATRDIFFTTAPFVVVILNLASNPFAVIANLMAVAGAQLVASALPYTPPMDTLSSMWDYLRRTRGLHRGCYFFYREHYGAVVTGKDQQLYAAGPIFA